MEDQPLSCSIRNTSSSAVISLYPRPHPGESTFRPGDALYRPREKRTEQAVVPVARRSSVTAAWNVRSLLRRKKAPVPRLCPELEGAIIKSESLAYLTEPELLARHQRNKEIQRVSRDRWTDRVLLKQSVEACY